MAMDPVRIWIQVEQKVADKRVGVTTAIDPIALDYLPRAGNFLLQRIYDLRRQVADKVKQETPSVQTPARPSP